MHAATGNHGAATTHTEEPQLAAPGRNDVATEHAQEPPPAAALHVLFCTEDIQQLIAAERALVPKRSLHNLARDAFSTITEAGPQKFHGPQP